MGNQIKYVSRLPEFVKEKEIKDGKTYHQGEIAQILGVSRQAVNRWFSDGPIEFLNMKLVEAASKWLGVEWHQLVERHKNGKH